MLSAAALVSPTPGTTRDYLVNRVEIDGTPIELIDTAGLRAAADTVRISSSPSLIATAASALARAGQTAKARQFLGDALEKAKKEYVCRFIVADAYADLGEKEKALESMQQAFLERST